MHEFASIEENFQVGTAPVFGRNGNDETINNRYSKGEGRILIETNRERLQVFVEALRKPGYLDLSPFYQRRERWGNDRKSLLIESFIMNIPVPPVFLYEREFNQYEVMDGQQRISAIRDFYDDQFALEGLEYWPELEGRRYSTLPEKIKAGIDRRSLSSIVLLKESAADDLEVSLIRRVVFDRLNRGGVKLERQEIRNALFPSPFNILIHELASEQVFRKAWNIPQDDFAARRMPFYQKMGDLEVVLRFFALRHADKLEGPLQKFLDDYMLNMKTASNQDIEFLSSIFKSVLKLGNVIYEDFLFRTWDPDKNSWSSLPNKSFCDCVLTGLSWNLDKADYLAKNKIKVIDETKKLFQIHETGTFTGRKSTKKDLTDRLKYYREMLANI